MKAPERIYLCKRKKDLWTWAEWAENPIDVFPRTDETEYIRADLVTNVIAGQHSTQDDGENVEKYGRK